MSARLLAQAVQGRWPGGTHGTGRERVAKVYLYMASLAEDGGDLCWCSQRAIADALKIARRDVQNAQRYLKAEHFIFTVAPHVKGQRGTVYRIVVKEACQRDPDKPAVLQEAANCSCSDCAVDRNFAYKLTETVAEIGDGKDGGVVPSTRNRETKKNNPPSLALPNDGLFSQEMIHVAREAISEITRDLMSEGYGADGYSEVRHILDEKIFWMLVEYLRGLPEQVQLSSKVLECAIAMAKKLAAEHCGLS